MDQQVKLSTINRCFFDAEHGWLTLSLKRIEYLYQEFPDDPQVEYAEALIRKDFLGDGIKAEELFIKAQNHATIKNKSNENFLFSTFNSVKYARNEAEFREQYNIANSIAPEDQSISFFNQILDSLNSGKAYSDILSEPIDQFQKHSKHGECAAFTELALQFSDLSFDTELAFRTIRAISLRELDKAAESSHNIRGEDYPPEERLVLINALKELEIALNLDPDDHKLWNYKSAWLFKLNKFDESIEAADKSLALCPVGYIKPRTNKALCLQKLGKYEESKLEADKAFREAETIGDAGKSDKELAKYILDTLSARSCSDYELINIMSDRIIKSTQLTSRQEMSQWKKSDDGKILFRMLKMRVFAAGKSWSNSYIEIMEEMLVYFCPESIFESVSKLGESNIKAYDHCKYAVLYLSAYKENVVMRDACRLLIYFILNPLDPSLIKNNYRKLILGSSTTEYDEFKNLEKKMRNEFERLNSYLLKLIADQPPLNQDECEFARNITMSRFIDGKSRDPEVKQESFLKNLLNRFF